MSDLKRPFRLQTECLQILGRRQLIVDIAQEIGLERALEDAKLELFNTVQFYHTLRNRASKSASGDVELDEIQADEVGPDKTGGFRLRRHSEDQATSAANPPDVAVDDDEEGRNIAEWDFRLIGEPGSETRIAQVCIFVLIGDLESYTCPLTHTTHFPRLGIRPSEVLHGSRGKGH